MVRGCCPATASPADRPSRAARLQSSRSSYPASASSSSSATRPRSPAAVSAVGELDGAHRGSRDRRGPGLPAGRGRARRPPASSSGDQSAVAVRSARCDPGRGPPHPSKSGTEVLGLLRRELEVGPARRPAARLTSVARKIEGDGLLRGKPGQRRPSIPSSGHRCRRSRSGGFDRSMSNGLEIDGPAVQSTSPQPLDAEHRIGRSTVFGACQRVDDQILRRVGRAAPRPG